MNNGIGVVVRDFTPGAGRLEDGILKKIDFNAFRQKSQATVSLLNSGLVRKIVIVSNRDASSKFGEQADENGDTPTWCMYKEIYPELVESGALSCVFVDQWGNNAGSGRAVQAGIDYLLKETDLPFLMAWSPELQISSEKLIKAMTLLEHYNLDGIGFLREHYATRPQWMLPQYTALVASRECWGLAKIPAYTDGDEGLKVETSLGPANLAGMDDLARLLPAWKVKPSMRLGMYGWSDPLPWNIDPNEPRQAKKIARQWPVALEWTRRTFPDQEPEAVLNHFLASIKML